VKEQKWIKTEEKPFVSMFDNTTFVLVTKKKERRISLNIKSGKIMRVVTLAADFKLSIIYFHTQIIGEYFIWFTKLKQT
jgi:hypothetical protein